MMILILLSTLFISMVYASPAEEPKEFHIPLLDAAQNLVGGNANYLANRVDSFFADERADDELARSTVRVSQGYTLRDREKLDSDTRFRFNIKLPQLEEKFKFQFEKKKKEAQDQKIYLTEQEIRDRQELDTSWQFRSDVGVNVTIPPNVFARSRVRKNFQTKNFIHRFVEEIGWHSERHWRESTTFYSDHKFADNLLFRFQNTKDWLITDKEFSTNHGPSLFHTLSIEHALSYSLNLRSVIEDSIWYVSNYTASVTYRRNLYKHWIFMDITPGLDFPKTWSFRRTPFIAFKVEALFGGI